MRGRKKEYFAYEIPTSTVRVVTSICADYNRREAAIKHSAVTGAVLARYVELNNAVDVALYDVEPGIRDLMLRDVADGVGYNRSAVACQLSKNAYYRRRRKLVYDIAVNLSLL